MTTCCWFTGKHWNGFIRDGVNFYADRLKPVLPVQIDILKEGGPGQDGLQRESEQILKRLQPGDVVILLDEAGRSMDSRGFASFLGDWRQRSPKRLIFILGGAYGFAPEIRDRASGLLSLSPMTFNHQLARVVFLEQLYRGMTILNGHPYHHD